MHVKRARITGFVDAAAGSAAIETNQQAPPYPAFAALAGESGALFKAERVEMAGDAMELAGAELDAVGGEEVGGGLVGQEGNEAKALAEDVGSKLVLDAEQLKADKAAFAPMSLLLRTALATAFGVSFDIPVGDYPKSGAI